MVAKNDITGDQLKSKPNSKAYEDNYDRIFGKNKKVEKGRYRQCRETGKFIPLHEWLDKYGEPPKPRTHFVMGDIEPFQSPIDGRYINSRSHYRDDLKRHNCRPYEGLEQEEKAASQVRAEQERKFDRDLTDAIEKTDWQLRENMTKPATGPINAADMFSDD